MVVYARDSCGGYWAMPGGVDASVDTGAHPPLHLHKSFPPLDQLKSMVSMVQDFIMAPTGTDSKKN